MIPNKTLIEYVRQNPPKMLTLSARIFDEVVQFLCIPGVNTEEKNVYEAAEDEMRNTK